MLRNQSGEPVQLVLLHFAGGSAYSFRQLEPYLKGFELVTPELPGRGRRIGEPLICDFEAAAADICQQILQSWRTPAYLIYGHSMGAILALRVTQLLEGMGKPPLYLIVSGTAGPGTQASRKRYLLEKEQFIEEVYRLGGLPEELREYPEMMEFFEPILRADFQVAEGYHVPAAALLNVPVFAMMGDQEEKAAEIQHWQQFTSGPFDHEILEGGHFFIHRHPQRVADIIRTCYHKIRLPEEIRSR